jgi:flavin-dependent dehydrogenase
MTHVNTVVVGAGPGGLACAKSLAQQGREVLVLERKHHLGQKVCAGGITFSGLISRLPETLVERSFCRQYVCTTYQSCFIEEKTPIIATVNREKLGIAMAKQATEVGAVIRTGVNVRAINDQSLLVQDRTSKETQTISFDYLVGADGSSSLVRRHLGLQSNKLGIGINYSIPGQETKMEWHLNNKLFANGYAWIFPHADTISVGAYAPRTSTTPSRLKNSLLQWAEKQGYSLSQERAKAEYINFDFQGWNFGKTFLVGDAAGLASGLTGEGIYPAIISGEQVAATILDHEHRSSIMDNLIKRHEQHSRIVQLSGKSGILNTLLSELMTLGLRSGIVRFSQMEMAA